MDRSTTILLVEGDVNVAISLLIGLQNEGFLALHAADGHWALKLARAARPDVVLLDMGLPQIDGLAVCRSIRRASAVPIVLLTHRGQEQEGIQGLELGADGYLVKPFSFREVLARVRGLLRRRAPNGGDRIVVGDIVLNRTARQVWRAGHPIRLRRLEFDLLQALMESAGKAVPRRELLNQVWGQGWVGNPRTLDVHICWLREKLEEDPSVPRYIQTLRGYGHRFVDPTVRSAGKLSASADY